MAGQIVQSIILPNTIKGVGDLAKVEGFEFLTEAQPMKKERYGRNTVAVFVAKSAVGDVREIPIGKTGGIILAGELTGVEKAEGNPIAIPPGIANVEVASPPNDGYTKDSPVTTTLGMKVEEEWHYFLDILWGSLRQSGVDPAMRKAIVVNALRAFENFLTAIIENAGTASVQFDKTSEPTVDENMSKQEAAQEATQDQQKAETLDISNPEQLRTFIVSAITDAVTAITPAAIPNIAEGNATEKQEKPHEDEEMQIEVLKAELTTLKSEIIEAMTEETQKLKADMEALSQRIQAVEHSVDGTEPDADNDGDETKKSETEKPTGWGGVWFRG